MSIKFSNDSVNFIQFSGNIYVKNQILDYTKNKSLIIKSRNFNAKNDNINRAVQFLSSIQDCFTRGDLIYCIQDFPHKYLSLLTKIGHVISALVINKPNSKIYNIIVLNPAFDIENEIVDIGFQLNPSPQLNGVSTGMLYVEMKKIIIGCVYDPWISNRNDRCLNYKSRYTFIEGMSKKKEKGFVAIGDFNPRSNFPIIGDLRNRFIPNTELTEIINLIPMYLLAIVKSKFTYRINVGLPKHELDIYSEFGVKRTKADTFKLCKPFVTQGVNLGWVIDACQSVNTNLHVFIQANDDDLSDHKEITAKIVL